MVAPLPETRGGLSHCMRMVENIGDTSQHERSRGEWEFNKSTARIELPDDIVVEDADGAPYLPPPVNQPRYEPRVAELTNLGTQRAQYEKDRRFTRQRSVDLPLETLSKLKSRYSEQDTQI